MPPYEKSSLLERLADESIDATTHEHDAVFTVAESEELHAKLPGGHSKNLFLKDKKSRYFLVTAAHDTQIDLKRIHKLIGAQGRVSFGKADALMDLLGVEPGSVTPFGVVNDVNNQVTMVLDTALLEHDIGNYHPLTNTATTAISQTDLIAFLKGTGHDPMIVDVSENNPALDG
ncbi:MAG: prolyl-tRNA synthetase associated domain-containing protein [Pseudomonadota bacterium]